MVGAPFAGVSQGVEMREIAEALSRMEAMLHPVGTETLDLDEAIGRVCAVRLAARLDAPPFAVAAMDGYAMRWADASFPLRCLGTARAGDSVGLQILPGTCCRIFTGAPVPPGADTVVVQELAAIEDERVRVLKGAEAHRHIRLAGSNLRTGDPVVKPGLRLTARHIGLIAAAGHAEVSVHRRARVAVLSTGNELSDRFAADRTAQILDTNRPTLKALVRTWGGVPIDLGIVPDEPGALSATVTRVLDAGAVDLLVTSGGASVGDFDYMKPTLTTLGFEPAFRKVRMRPGKATLFGRIGKLPVLGLPGNAVAALIGALIFLRPALSLLEGTERGALAEEQAALAAPLPATGPRTTILRGHLGQGPNGGLTFAALADQDNAMLSGLSAADALALRPANAPPAAIGEPVAIVRFDRMPGF